jgi:hypothetical protein
MTRTESWCSPVQGVEIQYHVLRCRGLHRKHRTDAGERMAPNRDERPVTKSNQCERASTLLTCSGFVQVRLLEGAFEQKGLTSVQIPVGIALARAAPACVPACLRCPFEAVLNRSQDCCSEWSFAMRMNLYGREGARSPTFCGTLAYTGCRINVHHTSGGARREINL